MVSGAEVMEMEMLMYFANRKCETLPAVCQEFVCSWLQKWLECEDDRRTCCVWNDDAVESSEYWRSLCAVVHGEGNVAIARSWSREVYERESGSFRRSELFICVEHNRPEKLRRFRR